MNRNQQEDTQQQTPVKLRPKVIDLRGRVFNRLTVVEFHGLNSRSKATWLCRCICGAEVVVCSNALKYGNSQSCGCLKSENTRRLFRKHGGHKKIASYICWVQIKQRCFNPKNKNFGDYGGRGITMWAGWVHDFWAFHLHIGPRPSPLHSVERINTNGNYEPGNVRWATHLEQVNNARSNINITFRGKTRTMTGWARELGVDKNLIRMRIRIYKWSVDKALTTPVPKHKKYERHNRDGL